MICPQAEACPEGKSVKKAVFSLSALVGFIGIVHLSSALAQPGAPSLTDRDRSDIQELVTHYARALSSCAVGIRGYSVA